MGKESGLTLRAQGWPIAPGLQLLGVISGALLVPHTIPSGASGARRPWKFPEHSDEFFLSILGLNSPKIDWFLPNFLRFINLTQVHENLLEIPQEQPSFTRSSP
uniref:Uncharacterized protein n=1 Tax=Solanum tuberosum TaxID=4113 RepID=M1DSU2_SOLTU